MGEDAGPGDTPGGVSAAADAAAAAAEAASLGFDVGTPGTSTGPSSSISVSGNLGQDVFSILDQLAQGKGQIPANMPAGLLNQLNDAGLGNLAGFNPNNPTQTVGQMVAANNMHAALNTALPGLMASLVPGGNIALSGLNAFNALQSGKSTPGQALTSFGLGALGVPGPVVSAMQGQFGPAAGGLAQAGLAGLLSPSLGAMAGPALNLSGVGPAVGQAVSNAVPNAQDPGILSGISNALDQALSGFSGFSLGNIAPGTPPTPGSTQTLDGGTGISQETYPVAAAIEQAAQEFKPPTRGREMVAGRYGPTMQYEFGA